MYSAQYLFFVVVANSYLCWEVFKKGAFYITLRALAKRLVELLVLAAWVEV